MSTSKRNLYVIPCVNKRDITLLCYYVKFCINLLKYENHL